MTVPIDTLINFAIGQGMALAAAHDIRARQSGLLCESFGMAFGFAAACFAPLGLFLFWAYPDWSVMYAWQMTAEQAQRLKWVVPWIYLAACVAGYALAHRDVRAGHTTRAWALFVVVLVAETALSLGGAARLMRVGSFLQFREGTAPALWQDPLAPLLVSVGALFALSLAFLVTRLAARGHGAGAAA
ncbi:MAG: hypothetical protein U0610_33470 [bacterium]